MRARCLLVAGLMSLCAESVHADRRVTRIATTNDYPPFSYCVDGSYACTAPGDGLTGFDVDIARALCDEANLECEIAVYPWPDLLDLLEAGEIDAIVASMAITEARLLRVDFTDKYYSSPPWLAALTSRGYPTGGTGFPGWLAGKSVGYQPGTIFESLLDLWISEGLDVQKGKPHATLAEATDDLLAGTVDLVLADSISLTLSVVNTHPGIIALVGPPIDGPIDITGRGAGVAVRKGDKLRDRLSKAIRKIRDRGIYQLISDAYFGRDIY